MTDLIEDLGRRLRRQLESLVPRGTPVALVNYPNHRNAGDPAVWLGARVVAHGLSWDVRYECEWRTYSPDGLAAALPRDGVILINGGGNFGDVYMNQQGLRERVLSDFPHIRTIQLPQSIWFRSDTNRDRVRELVEAHRDLTLLVRDQRSDRYAGEHFDVDSRLVPDLALALGRMRRRAGRVDVLFLKREDPESAIADVPDTPGLVVSDWLKAVEGEPVWPPELRQLEEDNRRLTACAEQDPEVARSRWPELAATYEPLARARVRRGVDILSFGRAVITDRLHGHLLALLAGIPHVVLDNNYGKVFSMLDTWTGEHPLVRRASTVEEALDILHASVGSARR